ncbi:hypothetical protein LINPERPRIM_LOCUS12511 [Linum perenne]
MCPLRIILVFLSATLAGFFLFRNINSQTPLADDHRDDSSSDDSSSTTRFSKVRLPHSLSFDFTSTVAYFSPFFFTLIVQLRSAVESVFWTCVDMASGRYLWRHLTAASSSTPQRCGSSD